MPIDILMPQLSPTMTEGRLSKWNVKEGDTVSAGDVIAEVETDKATMEVEASDDGIMHAIMGKPGADIQVGVPIAVMREDGESVPKGYKPTAQVAEAGAEAEEDEDESEAKPATKASASASQTIQTKVNLAPDVPEMKVGRVEGPDGGRVSASPVARRLAEQRGIQLGRLTGSGPNGRIVKEDVERAIQGAGGAVVRGHDAKIPHTPMRKAIAGRLTESKQHVPHFYLTSSVLMDSVLDARKQLNALADGAYKISVNDMIIKACAMALKKNPAANASFYDDAVIQYGNVDVSVAVATPGGLITPIVKNADQKPIAMISNEMKELAGRAREGSLQPEEYQGGGFSLSNLGMYGVKEFKAIVNPPQGAILAVGGSEKRPVVNEAGNVTVASVMDISLSADHRVIDGALGAELLRDIKFYLENPLGMFV